MIKVYYPTEEHVREQVEKRASPYWYFTGGYDRREVKGFTIYWIEGETRSFRAETKEQLVVKILKYFIDQAKSDELRNLAEKYAKEHGRGYGLLLPKKGLVKLVMANCPMWKETYGKYDARGAGMSIGRRVSKLNIKQEGTYKGEPL